MNLSRVKVWTAEILYASDLNAEFDNILNHEIANADISATAAIEGSKLKNADIDLTTKVKGILPASKGGTGVADDTYDADKVDGIHAAAVATANKLFPLDANKLFPAINLAGGMGIYVLDNTNVVAAADAEQSFSTGDWTKKKEITNHMSGINTIRVKFDLYGGNVTFPALAKIYKNGVAYGTQRSRTTTSYYTYSEDLSFAYGDKIQLYVYKASGTSPALKVRNFRLYGHFGYSVDLD